MMMPLYEYECEQDGSVIEVLRSMADADKPLDDPDGKGRHFKRRQSTFATGAAVTASSGRSVPLGGCCPCGKAAGSCGAA
jgi:putative FmdB family regulatory protein